MGGFQVGPSELAPLTPPYCCCTQGTIYGAGTDAGGTSNAQGACSFGTNLANTDSLPWSTPPSGASDGGTGLPITYIAMNNVDFAGSEACGACIWFRGTGAAPYMACTSAQQPRSRCAAAMHCIRSRPACLFGRRQPLTLLMLPQDPARSQRVLLASHRPRHWRGGPGDLHRLAVRPGGQ